MNIKLFTRFCITAILAALILLSSACSASGEDNMSDDRARYDYTLSGEVSSTTGQAVVFIENNASEYKIVRADKLDAENIVVKASQELRRAIEEMSGVQLELATDWVRPDTDLTLPEYQHEILIGNTGRQESASVLATLREMDYAIEVVNGKLVIIGGCEEKTVEAVEKFIQLYFSAEQPSLILDEGYRYQSRHQYNITGMTVNGTALRDHVIIYEEGYENAAYYLARLIKNNTGFVLETRASTEQTSGNEIIIGNTVRGVSDLTLEDKDYAVLLTDSGLLIKADSPDKASVAVRALADELFKESVIGLDIAAGFTHSGNIGEGSTHSVLSINVYLSGFGENSVPNRYPRLVSLVESNDPDLLCLQEVSSTTWYELITKGDGTNPALTDEYTFVGTGRNGKEGSYDVHVEGAYNAILFRTAKYDLVESGTFWLSETPDTPSVGWDGRIRAICTWAVLREKGSDNSFLVLNTQLDTYGEVTEANSAELICSFVEEKGLPALLCGDFGTNNKGDAFKGLTSLFNDCTGNTEQTQNNYGENVTVKGATDFILSTGGDTGATNGMLITDLIDGKYVSNHWALKCTLEIYG